MLLTINTYTFGQSISVSKLLNFLISQNEILINKELKEIGFIYKGTAYSDGFIIKPFIKNTTEITEEFIVSKNNELFCLLYKVDPNFFNGYKVKLLTDNFTYSYEVKGNEYYENNDTRIGFNRRTNTISLFVKINSI